VQAATNSVVINGTSCTYSFSGATSGGAVTLTTTSCKVAVDGATIVAEPTGSSNTAIANVTLSDMSPAKLSATATTATITWSCSGVCTDVGFATPIVSTPAIEVTPVAGATANTGSFTVKLVGALPTSNPSVTLTPTKPADTTVNLYKGTPPNALLFSNPYIIALEGVQLASACPSGVTMKDVSSTGMSSFDIKASPTAIWAFKFVGKRLSYSSYTATWTTNNRDLFTQVPSTVTVRVSKNCGDFTAPTTPYPVGRCLATGGPDNSARINTSPTTSLSLACKVEETDTYYLNMKFTDVNGNSGCSASTCALSLEF
jgi:hypothetical protein